MSKKTPVLVNIRGCNGAGKSTVPMMMNDLDEDAWIFDSKEGWKITIFPKFKWVALGTYKTKTGGMDTISTKAQKQAALRYAWKTYPEHDILMEGVIDSTILSTYVDLFQGYQLLSDSGRISERKIIVLNYLPPLDVCVSRVYERNGGKPVKEDQIESKWNSVYRNADKFREAGIRSLKWDNSKTHKADMLTKFLQIVDKYRER